MLLRVTTLLVAIAAFCSADSLTLRSGRVVHGQYLGGDARQIRMAVGDRVDTFDVAEVSNLQFGNEERLPSQNSGGDRDRDRDRDRQGPPSRQQDPPPPPPQQNASYGTQLQTGTPITVRMIDGVDSEETRLGQTFRASVDEPVIVDGQTVIPRGADCVVKLVEDKESGKFAGRTVLTLALQQVMANGRMIDVTTGDVSQASGSRGARTAKVVGGTTAVGAIIGAIAGGGTGAAIGAASGAAVGGAAQVMTKGQRVKIPSETRLTFTLQQPANL
ncbi:MAG TPA: hypothetical protein VH157_10600 [Bryobacteraceae bacterium]|nr:hypothetical protein [Bryobacteraceae bacterium]